MKPQSGYQGDKSSSLSNDHHLSKQIHRPIPVQNYEKSEYVKYMPTITEKEFKQKQQLLTKHGFISTNGVYHQFESAIIQVKNQMVVYQVTFGYYKTQFSAFCCNIDLVETRGNLGNGNFGEVMELKLDGRSLAAKCIKKSAGSLYPSNQCLKQLFLIKFASVLEVGPQYDQSYSYDILVLKHHCEFVMELCKQPKFEDPKAKNQAVSADMMNALAILHAFKCVHMDIKPDNISYSPISKKFVFLDFGLSEFISEGVGNKTLVHPRGTYKYMNKDMQNALGLNKKSFIDLYDNDMFGLKQTLKIKGFYLDLGILCKKIGIESLMTYEWSEFLDYFKASYYLNISHYVKFEELVMHQKNLPFCIRRLVRQGDLDEKTKTKYVQYLNHVCSEKYPNKNYDQILKLNCADSELYIELNKAESENLEKFEKDLKNIELLYHQKQFKDFWRSTGWIDQIFKLLFFKKNLSSTQRELKQNLTNFICEQRPYTDDQKYLKVLAIFREQYEIHMDTKRLLQIRFLYESAGLLKEADQINRLIWELTQNSGDELMCVLNLKYYFCEFIVSELQGFPFFFNDMKAPENNDIPFNVALKVIEQVTNINRINESQRPTISTFDKLWDLFKELENVIKEEKAQMVIVKVKKLLLHLQYGLIDICYVATNQHQEKYDIEEKVKADLNDSIFKIKRQFIAVQKQSHQYLPITVPMQKITQKTRKYCTQTLPFLSKVSGIWQFGQYIDTERFQDAEKLLRYTLDKDFSFDLLFSIFERHLIKSFKHSNRCFQIFLEFLRNIINHKQSNGKPKDVLRSTNRLLLKVSLLWDPLFSLGNQKGKVKDLTQLYFLISLKLKEYLRQWERDQMIKEEMSQVFRCSEYIEAVGHSLMDYLKGNNFIKDTKTIQLLIEMSQSTIAAPCIFGCYSLLKISAKFFSDDLEQISQQYIFDTFNNKRCLDLAVIYLNYKFVQNAVIQGFCCRSLYRELQEFELGVSFQIKNTRYLKVRVINYEVWIFKYQRRIPLQCIIQFCNQTLWSQSLEETYNNSIFLFITYKCLYLVRERLELQVQKRLIVLISNGLPIFVGEQMKRQIKGYILKLQVLLNKQWNGRKKLINVKKQKIARKVSLIEYKTEVMAKIKKITEERESKSTMRKIMEILKSKLKRIKMSGN